MTITLFLAQFELKVKHTNQTSVNTKPHSAKVYLMAKIKVQAQGRKEISIKMAKEKQHHVPSLWPVMHVGNRHRHSSQYFHLNFCYS
jgi:hypothetical protein